MPVGTQIPLKQLVNDSNDSNDSNNSKSSVSLSPVIGQAIGFAGNQPLPEKIQIHRGSKPKGAPTAIGRLMKPSLAAPENLPINIAFETRDRLVSLINRPETFGERLKRNNYQLRHDAEREAYHASLFNKNKEYVQETPLVASLVWPSTSNRTKMKLTVEQKQKLLELGHPELIPGSNVSGYDRYDTIQRAIAFLENPELNNESENNGGELTKKEINELIKFGAIDLIPLPLIQGGWRVQMIETALAFLDNPNISDKERQLLIEYGRSDLIPGDVLANRYHEILDARDFLESMKPEETKEENESLNSENMEYIRRLASLTEEEKERLIELDVAHLIPGPEVQGYDMYSAVDAARDYLREQDGIASSGSRSSSSRSSSSRSSNTRSSNSKSSRQSEESKSLNNSGSNE